MGPEDGYDVGHPCAQAQRQGTTCEIFCTHGCFSLLFQFQKWMDEFLHAESSCPGNKWTFPHSFLQQGQPGRVSLFQRQITTTKQCSSLQMKYLLNFYNSQELKSTVRRPKVKKDTFHIQVHPRGTVEMFLLITCSPCLLVVACWPTSLLRDSSLKTCPHTIPRPLHMVAAIESCSPVTPCLEITGTHSLLKPLTQPTFL